MERPGDGGVEVAAVDFISPIVVASAKTWPTHWTAWLGPSLTIRVLWGSRYQSISRKRYKVFIFTVEGRASVFRRRPYQFRRSHIVA